MPKHKIVRLLFFLLDGEIIFPLLIVEEKSKNKLEDWNSHQEQCWKLLLWNFLKNIPGKTFEREDSKKHLLYN